MNKYKKIKKILYDNTGYRLCFSKETDHARIEVIKLSLQVNPNYKKSVFLEHILLHELSHILLKHSYATLNNITSDSLTLKDYDYQCSLAEVEADIMQECICNRNRISFYESPDFLELCGKTYRDYWDFDKVKYKIRYNLINQTIDSNVKFIEKLIEILK